MKEPQKIVLELIGDGIVARPAGESETCDHCSRNIEVFATEALEARFLIVKLSDVIFRGGGRCESCQKFACISCAVKTVYGDRQRRLHCPDCGLFLVGIRRQAGSANQIGGYLTEPDFRKKVAIGEVNRPGPSDAENE